MGEQLPSFPSRDVPPLSQPPEDQRAPALSQCRARSGTEARNDSPSGACPPQRPPGCSLPPLLPTPPGARRSREAGGPASARTSGARVPQTHSHLQQRSHGCARGLERGWVPARPVRGRRGPEASAGASTFQCLGPGNREGPRQAQPSARKQGTVCQAGDQGGGWGEGCWGPTSARDRRGRKTCAAACRVRTPHFQLIRDHQESPGPRRLTHPGPDFSPPTPGIPPE